MRAAVGRVAVAAGVVVGFPDRDDAAAAAPFSAGDSYPSGWIVVRFEPGS